MSSASAKLFLRKTFAPSETHHVFAAFACRLLLEICQNEAGTRLATESVRSHMRILVGAHDEFIETQAPSEPILAAAAAQALNVRPEGYKSAIGTFLNRLVLDSYVSDRGLQGELCCRFLFMLARDKATFDSAKGNRNYTHNGSIRSVTLSAFLRALCGDNFGIVITKNGPRLEEDHARFLTVDALSSLAETGHINFTHFIQLSTSFSELSEETLFEAWCRHAAIQCSFDQAMIDGVIVVYFGDLDEEFDKGKLGYVVWQSKAKSAADSALANQFIGPIIFKEKKHDSGKIENIFSKPPYIALFMELGTSSRFGTNGPLSSLTYGVPTPQTKGKNPWRLDDEPKRFCLNIRNNTKDQYPVLDHFGCDLDFARLFQRSLSYGKPELDELRKQLKEDMNVLKVK